MSDAKKCPRCGGEIPTGSSAEICPRCAAALLGAPESEVTGEAMPKFTPPTVAELAPLFPQLEILELLGRGGMGAVYKARQKHLDRMVALKILPPRIGADTAFAERFTREALALARLNHPGIVTIYDFGRANDLYFFLMEFVDGVNLRELMERGQVASREAMSIVTQICDALQFAHDQGIVHRDIKPANILLDKRGRVKVADFGVAKLMGVAEIETAETGAVSTGSSQLTEAGKVMGTPSYIAPEQMEHPQEADHRVDIYALGVVFYQLLTGELPGAQLQPPSRKVQIDVRLDDIVLHALEKQPQQRYQNISEMKTAVDTLVSTPGPMPRGTPPEPPPVDAEGLTQQILSRDYWFSAGSCVSKGWQLVKNDLLPIVGVTLLIMVLLSALSAAGQAADNASDSVKLNLSVLTFLLSGPLMGGLYLYLLKKMRGEKAGAEVAFWGFKKQFLQLLLASFVAGILTAIGFVCCVLPGIFLWVAWLFVVPLVADKGIDFWPAMNLSFKTVCRHWFLCFWLVIVMFLVNVMGFLCCLVGLLVSIPVSLAALMYAYEEIFRSPQQQQPVV